MIKNFTQFLQEKRSNPDLNPKISAYDELKPFSDKDGYYISFTSLDKLGINPNSKYETPLGIYSYPLKDSWEKYKVEETKDFSNYPFANDEPYIWLFESKDKSKVVFLDNYKKSDYKNDIKKLKALPNTVLDWDRGLDSVEKDSFKKTYSGYFWNLIRWAANNYRNPEKKFSNHNVLWNKLFRDLGYTSVVDSNGIIHSNEPLQAVFFSKTDINIVKKVLNKTTTQNDNIIFIRSPDDIKKIDLNDLITNFDLWSFNATESPFNMSGKDYLLNFDLIEKIDVFISKNKDYINTEIKNINLSNTTGKILSGLDVLLYKLINHFDFSKYPNILNFYIKVFNKFKLYKGDFDIYENYISFINNVNFEIASRLKLNKELIESNIEILQKELK